MNPNFALKTIMELPSSLAVRARDASAFPYSFSVAQVRLDPSRG